MRRIGANADRGEPLREVTRAVSPVHGSSGPRVYPQFARQTNWWIVATAGAATVLLFAAAIVSMTRTGRLSHAPQPRDKVIVVQRLSLASPREPPPPRRVPSVRRTSQATTPASVETTSSRALTPAPTSRTPQPPAARIDTASIASLRALPPITVFSIAPQNLAVPAHPQGRGLGSPESPAGVTAVHAPGVVPILDLRGPMSAAAAASIAESQRQAEQEARRVATAGNSADLHVPTGQGVGGVGAVTGGVSIGVPLLSRGPSRAQRRRDSTVDADNRRMLADLAQRVEAKKVSIRAESLRVAMRKDSIKRADSLRADSARKRPWSAKP